MTLSCFFSVTSEARPSSTTSRFVEAPVTFMASDSSFSSISILVRMSISERVCVYKIDNHTHSMPVVFILALRSNVAHRGLQKFFETGKTAGIYAQHASRIRILLARLNVAMSPKDLDALGFHLPELKGKRKNTWSLRVHKNWKIAFSVEDGDVVDVDLGDYH